MTTPDHSGWLKTYSWPLLKQLFLHSLFHQMAIKTTNNRLVLHCTQSGHVKCYTDTVAATLNTPFTLRLSAIPVDRSRLASALICLLFDEQSSGISESKVHIKALPTPGTLSRSSLRSSQVGSASTALDSLSG